MSLAPDGATLQYPILVGALVNGLEYNDTKNNSTINGYTNNMGQASDDIYYKFVLSAASEVNLSHCSSGFDTYIHLLDASGTLLKSNDDGGPVCMGSTTTRASIKQRLNAGSYYVVSEGYSSSTGDITTTISLTNLFTGKADSLLSNLDKLRIPTNTLYDRVLPISELHTFNSVVPDTSSAIHFKQAYKEMFDGSFDKSSWLKLEDVGNIALGKVLSTTPAVPIAIADYRYSIIDPNAIANGKIIQTVDSMYYDASPTSNPYLIKNTFIASPAIDSIERSKSGNVLFNFSPNLIFNKSNRTISSMSVDFGNGGTPVSVNLSSENAISVNYPTSGVKVLKFTASFSNGTSVVTKAALKITPAALFASSGNSISCQSTTNTPINFGTCDFNNQYDICAAYPFQGYNEGQPIIGRGRVRVWHSRTTCDGIIRKPIIILDGFDPGSEQSADELYDDYLNNDDNGFFGDRLRNLGYDVIVLDFPKYQIGTKLSFFQGYIPQYIDGGSDYIERNAMVLISLIKRINQEKQGNEKLVIVGPSMGGLISRYALSYMEKVKKEPHNTKLWISFDSPHNGANIPIGDQQFLDYFSSLSGEAKSNRDAKLGSTAAKQMLLNHYKADSDQPIGAPDFRDRFSAALNDIGYPAGDLGQPFRKVALVNGSLGGNLVNSPGQKAFTMEVRHEIAFKLFWWKVRIKTATLASAKMYFSPSPSGRKVTLEANHPLALKTSYYNTSSSVTGSLDNAPGGTYDTQATIAMDNNKVGSLSERTLFYSLVPDHSFINTKSALGYKGSNLNLAEDLSYKNLVCRGETPFDSYYGKLNENTPHVGLWQEASDWLTYEIAGTTPFRGPAVRPEGEFSITGPSSFCGSQTYTINSTIGVSNVTWSASGSFYISGPTTGTTVTVRSSSNGSGKLTATITSACGQKVATKSINTGVVYSVNWDATGNSSGTIPGYGGSTTWGPTNSGYNLRVSTGNLSNYTYTWSILGGTGYNSVNFNGPNAGFYLSGNYPNIILKLTVANPACGSTECTMTFTSGAQTTTMQQSSFTVFPNPSSNEVTISTKISLEESSRKENIEKSNGKPFKFKIYNAQGIVLKDGNSKDGEDIKVDTRNLPDDIYFLHVTVDNEKIIRQLLIKH